MVAVYCIVPGACCDEHFCTPHPMQFSVLSCKWFFSACDDIQRRVFPRMQYENFDSSAFPNTSAAPCLSTFPQTRMNLVSAVNFALDTALETDNSAILFGQDVAFGGVFRCSTNLRNKFGCIEMLQLLVKPLAFLNTHLGLVWDIQID